MHHDSQSFSRGDSSGIADSQLPAGRDPSTAELLEELRKCLPVLPILATQLQEVARNVEESVVRVCGSFMGIADRARQTAGQMAVISHGSNAVEAEEKVGVDDLVSTTREILGNLLRRIEQTNEFSGVAVARMQTMEGQITNMSQMLADIEDVMADARILALNGQLEAARAGVHGAAFSIVARETAKMADQAEASSKTAKDLIGEISQSIGQTSEELHKRSQADARDAARSRDEVNRSLDSMTSLNNEIEGVLQQSEKNSQQLARDIAMAVQTLQFQDAVNQRIEHVVHTLEEVHRTLQSRLDHEADGSSEDGQSLLGTEWAAMMAKGYTMNSEREVLAAHTSGEEEQASPDMGSNVELF
jgi:methyl-accepting chemotaxis protein